MRSITLEELFDAGAHFGHYSRRWNPKMKPYIYGVQEGVHVFDLEKTREALTTALEELQKYSREGKTILLIATKKQIKDKAHEIGEKLGILYVTERWLGGTLTNFDQIMRSIKSLAEMKDKMSKGQYSTFTKKERLLIERKIEKMQKSFGGLAKITRKPDIVIIIDTHREKAAVKEANMMGVPIIGVVDTNADPTSIAYPIPMNDDAASSLAMFMNLLEEALLEKAPKPTPTKKAKKSKKKVKVTK